MFDFCEKSVLDAVEIDKSVDNNFSGFYTHIIETLKSDLQRKSFVEGRDHRTTDNASHNIKISICQSITLFNKLILFNDMKFFNEHLHLIGDLEMVYSSILNNMVLSQLKESIALLKSEYLSDVCAIINQDHHTRL